jgi:hypothetical protein
MAEGFTRTTTTVPPRIHPCNNTSMGNVCYTTLQMEQMNHIIIITIFLIYSTRKYANRKLLLLLLFIAGTEQNPGPYICPICSF